MIMIVYYVYIESHITKGNEMDYNIKNRIENGNKDFKETNDCTVRAVAACADGDYPGAHALLAMGGRRHRKGTSITNMERALEQLGYRMEKLYSKWSHFENKEFDGIKTVRSFLRQPRSKLAGRKFILDVRDHVAAVVDGVCYDWTAEGRDGKPRLHRLVTVYEVHSTGAQVLEPSPETVAVVEPKPEPRIKEGNFVERVHAYCIGWYGGVPRRLNRKHCMEVTGLAHGTIGHAMDYIRRADGNLDRALELYRARH